MLSSDKYYNDIDTARLHRARELSEIKRIFSTIADHDPSGVGSKAAVVLTYACWEGFYNECVRVYFLFLKELKVKISDINWLLIVGALSTDFDSLRQMNHSPDVKRKFVVNLKSRLDCTFHEFDQSVVQSRSNLNFKKLKENCSLLGFRIENLVQHSIKIDKELVGWRHAAAHGSSPDLSSLNVAKHVEFTSSMLLIISDLFQSAIFEIGETLQT